MDLIKLVIGALGVAGTIRGLFGVWSGWEEYSIGKQNDDPQRQTRGQSGMIYGGMMAAGAASMASYIVAALSGLRF